MPFPQFPAPAKRLLGLVLWLGAVGVGMLAMANYELKPGVPNADLSRWPAEAALALDSTRPNLILFAHPRCPCTQATLTQLQQIAARCGEKIKLHIVFYQPAGESPEWVQTPLWRTAAEIPNATIKADPNGEIANRFGAATSGQALLFSANGELLFSGGITGARGHEGENQGQSRLLALVLPRGSESDSPQLIFAEKAGEESGPATTAVFGCSIMDANPGATSFR